MATFAGVVLWHQRKKDGTFNIKIRVTQGGKCKYIPTQWHVTEDDLKVPRGARRGQASIRTQKYLDLIAMRCAEYRRKCDALDLAIMDVGNIVEMLTSEKEEPFDLDIIAFWRTQIARMPKTTGDAYNVALKSFCAFLGHPTLSIKDITPSLLTAWTDTLPKWAAHNYPTRMNTIYKRAKLLYNDYEAGIVRIPWSPFSRFKIPPMPVPEKRSITAEEVYRIWTLPDEVNGREMGRRNMRNTARDIFILSFCLCGMNTSDLYECPPFVDGRVEYCRKKTRTRRVDKAFISIKVPDVLAPILERWADNDGEHAFRFWRHYASVETMAYALSYGLKRVQSAAGIGGVPLQFYAARHSWATIAANDCGIEWHTIAEALNHVEADRVTSMYVRRDWSRIDRANEAVINRVLGGNTT